MILKKILFKVMYQNLRDSFNGQIEPQEDVILPTKTVKRALLVYLCQSVFTGVVWAYSSESFLPLLLPVSSLFHVGSIWDSVTQSWKLSEGSYYERLSNDIELQLQQPPSNAALLPNEYVVPKYETSTTI